MQQHNTSTKSLASFQQDSSIQVLECHEMQEAQGGWWIPIPRPPFPFPRIDWSKYIKMYADSQSGGGGRMTFR